MAEVDGTAKSDPLDLVADIYDCVFARRRWRSFLARVSKTVGGCAAAIASYSPCIDRQHIEAHWNIGTGRCETPGTVLNPILAVVWLLGLDGLLATSILSGKKDGNPALWNERTLAPGAYDEVAVVPLQKGPDTISALLIVRSSGRGSYRTDDIAVLDVLAPHIRHAVEITRRLHSRPVAAMFLPAGAAANPLGIILTDRNAKILHTNAAAAGMLDGCALLCIEEELSARDVRSDTELRATIRNAGRWRNLDAHARGAPLIVRGPGTGAFALRVLPLRRDARLADEFSPSVAVFAEPLTTPENARKETLAGWRSAAPGHSLENARPRDVRDLVSAAAMLRPRLSV